MRNPGFLAVLLVASSPAAGGCGTQPVVKKVDHVTIECADAQASYALNGQLGLPVAWPFSEYPEFATGGVAGRQRQHRDSALRPPRPGRYGDLRDRP